MIRVVIVDDEAPARRKVARFLADHDDVEVLGEAVAGIEALELIRALKPDVVFLDVQMPDIDGIEVAQALATGDAVPRIVFVTAHDQYAIRAFEVSALDYLLKPFDRERFERALERVRSSAPPSKAQLPALLDGIRAPGTYLRRLLVPSGDKSFFVATNDIVRLESDRNNVAIHARNGSYAMRATLDSLEQRLDPQQFARIHRSHVVNIDAIKEVHPWFHGDYQIHLHDGSVFPWSRRFAAKRPDLLA